MRRFARPTSIASLVLAAGLFFAADAVAAGCTLLAVEKADAAKHRVYFTKFLKEDSSAGRYKQCRIVTKTEPGTETFFITPFRQDATLVVHKDNWP